MSDAPKVVSDLTRLLDFMRRQQPRGSEKRRLYECAQSLAESVPPESLPVSEPPEVPMRVWPLRLVR